MNFPPPPEFIEDMGADHIREEHFGVTVDYWGSDESVKKQLTAEELLRLHALPDKTGAFIEETPTLFRVAIFFNSGEEDEQGQYALWEVRADFMKLANAKTEEEENANSYALALIALIRGYLAHSVGENPVLARTVFGKNETDLSDLMGGN